MTANNAANVKVRAYRVKYVSGRKPGQKPSKNFKLKLTRSGIKLVGIYPKPFWFGNQMIPWNDIQKIEYSESEQANSLPVTQWSVVCYSATSERLPVQQWDQRKKLWLSKSITTRQSQSN